MYLGFDMKNNKYIGFNVEETFGISIPNPRSCCRITG
jgi:hypothetical protein